MTPIIFLDIDDVLCVQSIRGPRDIERLGGQLFSRAAADALARIHDELQGEVRYVISSNWRRALTDEHLEKVFRDCGIGFVWDHRHEHWYPRHRLGYRSRAVEISDWLGEHHRGEPWVAIDDPISGDGFEQPVFVRKFDGRVVLCEPGVGLTNEHVAAVLRALRVPVRYGDDLTLNKGRT